MLDTSQPRAPMGSLAWGAGRVGRLTGGEKMRLVRNLAYVQVRELVDAGRHRLGQLNPAKVELDSLLPPQDGLVADALALAEDTHEKALLFHSWRTYLFGTLFAAREGFAYDRSLFFAAAILHDIGLTKDHSPRICERCFALSGGEHVHHYLNEKGHSPEVSYKVGNDVAMHLNGWISRKRHGPEPHLVSRGAVCDLFGFGRRRITPKTITEVIQRFPRQGSIEALQFETAPHPSVTRPAVMTSVAGGKAPPDKFVEYV